MKRQRWPEKLFNNIGKVWSLVRCNGNRAVKLVLWSTLSRVLLQRIKHSDTNGLRYFFSSYFNKICLCMTSLDFYNLPIFKNRISLERKELFEHRIQHFFFSHGLLVYVSNWLGQKRCNFRRSTTLTIRLYMGQGFLHGDCTVQPVTKFMQPTASSGKPGNYFPHASENRSKR